MGTTSREQMVAELEATGEYRVLRRLKPREISATTSAQGRVGLIVDTETTGLDTIRDEVVELGLIAFNYADDGEIGSVIAQYEGLREPTVRMSEEAVAITNISPGMLEGKELDAAVVKDLVQRADLLIAHNAAFDRPLCERLDPVFESKPWACSATEVPWKKYGFDGVKLSYLLMQSGLYNNGHRALDDCWSLLEVLAQRLDDGTTALSALLRSARQTRYRLWVRAPFEARDLLRRRGYRWNPGGNGRPRAWWREGDRATVDSELSYLEGLGIPNGDLSTERQTAFDRYRLARGGSVDW